MKIDNYNFESDFYYLEYPLPRTSTLGTIYRHYLNNYIEFIHGCTEQQPERLEDEKKRYEIITALEYLKKLMPNSDDMVLKSGNEYLNVYDFSNNSYNNYYKKISIAHLGDPDNICNTFDIDYTTDIKIGMVFRFIKTSMFDIDDIKIKYREEIRDDICDKKYDDDGFIDTDIDFKTYRQYFNDCGRKHNDNNELNKCIRGQMIQGGNPDKIIEKIKTEQKFIKHDTIMYYYKCMHKDNKPITIEYESGNYYIIDGNHRVAYHILNDFEYIPVIIIFKQLEIFSPPSPPPSPQPSLPISRKRKSSFKKPSIKTPRN
jgi:hypothetical protein